MKPRRNPWFTGACRTAWAAQPCGILKKPDGFWLSFSPRAISRRWKSTPTNPARIMFMRPALPCAAPWFPPSRTRPAMPCGAASRNWTSARAGAGRWKNPQTWAMPISGSDWILRPRILAAVHGFRVLLPRLTAKAPRLIWARAMLDILRRPTWAGPEGQIRGLRPKTRLL